MTRDSDVGPTTSGSQRRTVLHIGPTKTGTTYLQHAMDIARSPLSQSGWLYPRAAQEWNQQAALTGLLGAKIPWSPNGALPIHEDQWHEVQAQVSNWSGNLVMSAEALATLAPDGATDLVAAMPGGRADIVITGRDLSRVLPSAYQNNCKNGSHIPAFTFYQEMANERADDLGVFWRMHRLPGLVERWQGIAGVDSVTLVTVPRSAPPGELWARFVAAAGIAIDVDPAPAVPKAKSNEAISLSEIHLLRALNKQLQDNGIPRLRGNSRRNRLIRETLRPRSPEERGPFLELTPSWVNRVREWAEQDIAELTEIGVRVEGDLADLLPVQPGTDATDADLTAMEGELAFDLATAAAALAAALYDMRKVPQQSITEQMRSRVKRGVKRRTKKLRGKS